MGQTTLLAAVRLSQISLAKSLFTPSLLKRKTEHKDFLSARNALTNWILISPLPSWAKLLFLQKQMYNFFHWPSILCVGLSKSLITSRRSSGLLEIICSEAESVLKDWQICWRFCILSWPYCLFMIKPFLLYHTTVLSNHALLSAWLFGMNYFWPLSRRTIYPQKMYSPLILSVYKHFYFLKTWKLLWYNLIGKKILKTEKKSCEIKLCSYRD